MLVPGAGIVRMVCVELMKAEAKLKTRHASHASVFIAGRCT